MKNLTITKEDFSINSDGSIVISNPELQAKIEEISIEPEDSLKHTTNNCPRDCHPTTNNCKPTAQK